MRRRTGVTIVAILRGLLPIVDPDPTVRLEAGDDLVVVCRGEGPAEFERYLVEGTLMGRELVVLGIAFLLAGLLARVGRRVGLPTIPLFMAAGILVGPNTPGPVAVRPPRGAGAARRASA